MGSLLVLEEPCWKAMGCILGFGRVVLQILEAILWPRGLPRAGMSDQKPRFIQNDGFQLVVDGFLVEGLAMQRQL